MDPERAGACVWAVASFPCGTFLSTYALLPDCVPAFQGVVPVGGSCVNSFACAGGGLCVRADAITAPCAGACKAKGTACGPRPLDRSHAERACARGVSLVCVGVGRADAADAKDAKDTADVADVADVADAADVADVADATKNEWRLTRKAEPAGGAVRRPSDQ